MNASKRTNKQTNPDPMKTISKLLIVALLSAASGLAAQSYESPALRAFREQQQRRAEEQQRQAELRRQEFEKYQAERAERERIRQEMEAERKRQSDALIEQINHAKEERLRQQQEAQERARREADIINQQNQERRLQIQNAPSSREPQVVQRREMSRTPVYSGGHSEATRQRVLTGYRVVYRTVWDNGTTTYETETVNAP
jgi:hypothetical protein